MLTQATCARIACCATARAAREVKSYSADVLLLQDVDSFKEWWQPQLNSLGYDGLFHKKTDSRRSGVAIFFRRERLQLFRSSTIDFDDVAADLKTSMQSRARQGDVGIMASLQPWEGCVLPSAILVVSAELTKGILFEQLRMWQAKLLTHKIENFNSDFHLPIFCGISMQETPRSRLYHAMCTGYMPRAPEPPKAPGRPAAKVLSMAAVRVEWEEPPCGDMPIQHYRVERRAGGNTVVGFVICAKVPVEERHAVITGLASGVSYEFRVTAVSAIGLGMSSKSSDPVTTPSVRDHPPENVHLVPMSERSISSDPTVVNTTDIGGSPSGYMARWSEGDAHVLAPPTRHGLPQRPMCSPECTGAHKVLIHRLEFDSAYAHFAKCQRKTAKAMRVMVHHEKYVDSISPADHVGGEPAAGGRGGGDDGKAEDGDGDGDAPSGAGERKVAERSVSPETGRHGHTAGGRAVASGAGDDGGGDGGGGDASGAGAGSGASYADGTAAAARPTSPGAGRVAAEADGSLSPSGRSKAGKKAKKKKKKGKKGDDGDDIAADGFGVGSLEPAYNRRRPVQFEKDDKEKDSVGTCDTYLFYSRGELRLRAFLSLMSPKDLMRVDKKRGEDAAYLPNRVMSSDHMALMGVFDMDPARISSMW